MNPLFETTIDGDCDNCGLDRGCVSPKMPYTGDGDKGILIIGEAPGAKEDMMNEQFIGKAGTFLRDCLYDLDIDLDQDCWKTNANRCRPVENKTPNDKQINCCRPLLFQEIKKLKPRKIFLFGANAVKAFALDRVPKIGPISAWINQNIPDEQTQAWVFPNYHPSFIQRMEGKARYETIFKEILERAVYWNKPFPAFSKRDYDIHFLDEREAISYLDTLKKGIISIDYETTGLKPHAKGQRIVSLSISPDPYKAYVFLMTDRIIPHFKRVLDSPQIKLRAQNKKFERIWSKEKIGTCGTGWCWDPLLGTHLLNNQTRTGLKFQVYLNFGIPDYSRDVDNLLEAKTSNSFNRINEIPVDTLLTYNAMDTIFECRLSLTQQPKILKDDALRRAYLHVHDANLALSDTEIHGFHLDMDVLNRTDKELRDKLVTIEKELLKFKEGMVWLKTYGARLNFDSNPQTATILYEKFGYTTEIVTDKGKPSVSAIALEGIESPFVKRLVDMRKIKKTRTFLAQFKRECVDSKIHCSIGFAPVTWRSSITRPSLQNIPSRDKEVATQVRSCIVPRYGGKFLDADYSSVEVATSACYHHDPNMIKYLWDPKSDMHFDTSMECYKLEPDEMTGDVRKCGKNSMVFPQFYGSYYVQCAINLWNDIFRRELKTKQGVPLKKHLEKHGIKNFPQFERHIQEVEDYFWNERFPVYKRWKEQTWQLYLEQGYLESYFGFRFSGGMDKNDALNYQIQNTAFHCLLWSYKRMTDYLHENKFKSKLILETHDNFVADIPEDEFNDFLSAAKRIFVDDLLNEFDWIIVPIGIEISATDVNEAWAFKKTLEEYKRYPKIKPVELEG